MKSVTLTILATIILLIAGCAPANYPPIIASPKPPNNPPIIENLIVTAEHKYLKEISTGYKILKGKSCEIKCIASDPDGDELSYEWFADDGNIDGDGTTITWNAPDLEGTYTLVVKVTDGNGGETTDSITITVRVNHPPTISSLIADKERITPLSSCQIECIASDTDGDRLTYTWSASGGSISDTGPAITWTAPETAGTYTITVKAKDDMGGESTSSLQINVAPNSPPIIENLIVTAEHKYLEEISTGYKILKGKSCNIECTASDPDGDELNYEWSTDGGNISRECPTATWTAPLRGGKVTITVTVSDSGGSVATKTIVFTVKPCASCAFR